MQKDSAYQHLDTNSDNVLCDDEIAMALEFKRRELEDADARRDSMRYMAWFCLFGTLNYPAAILITAMLGYDNTAKLITEILTHFDKINPIPKMETNFQIRSHWRRREQNFDVEILDERLRFLL